MLVSTELAHVGFMTKLPWYLRTGTRMHVLARWRAADALRTISRNRMPSVGGIGAQIALMLRQPDFDDYDLSSVKTIVVGGQRSSPALIEEARRRFQAAYSVRYSSTESGGVGTLTAFDAPDSEALYTVGRPREGIELAVRDEEGRPLAVVEVAGGYRLVTRPELAPWLVRLARSRTRQRLSRPALATLAIVAYRQPVSRPEVDAIRGVNSEGVLDSLLERRLIRIAGRKDAPGRPFLYETTREFLVAFGLRDLNDLPKVEGELTVPDVPAAADGHAPAEQDSGPDGPDVASGR